MHSSTLSIPVSLSLHAAENVMVVNHLSMYRLASLVQRGARIACRAHASTFRETSGTIISGGSERSDLLRRQRGALLHSSASASTEAAVTKVSPAQSELTVSAHRIASTTLPLNNGLQRVCVLGTGWGAARFLSTVDPKLYNITVCF